MTASAPDLPAAPSISGLRFRTYRGEEDIPALAELMNASGQANGDGRHFDIESLRVRFANESATDPRKDAVLAFIDDRLVALSRIGWADTGYGERHYHSVGHVHPEWRRRGIGSAMCVRNERRLAEIATTHRFDGPCLLTTWLHDLDAGGLALAEERGYERVRVFHHMVRPDMEDVEVPPLPEGIVDRPPRRGELRAVWDASSDAFSEHFGAADWSEAAFHRWTQNPRLDLGLLHIAFDGDEVVGGVHGWVDPGENELNGYRRGWVDPIWVRKPWRRRGLASALIGRTLVALRELGMTSAQLDVDSENSNQALTLYERHGFRVDHSSSEWHKPLVLSLAKALDRVG